MSWTVYGDPPNPSADPRLLQSELWAFRHAVHDFSPVRFDAAPTLLDPRVGARVSTDGGTTWTPAPGTPSLSDPVWSPVNLSIPPGNLFQFRIEFDWDEPPAFDDLNAVLMSSPILDDVTIVFEDSAYLAFYFHP
jgi:hypothetical protein